jgi:hypothetical protein
MSDTWGKGSVNNNIGWGQAAGSATNDWGKSQKDSWAGQTDIVGITSVSITYSSSAFCSDANDPTPTISNNAGAGTFSSTAGLVFISTTTGEVDISGSTAGSYVITYTDTDAATATFDLAINTIPTVTVSASAGTICDGESTILTASGANSYTWSNGGTGASITVSPSTTTLFTATGTDSNGCTSSGGTTITVNAQDSAAFSYAASSFCANGTDPSPTITGTAGGAFTSTAGITLNSSTGEIDLDASTVGTYSITYTTTGVCPDNQSTNITINAADNAAFAYSASSYEPTDADPTPTITGLTGGTFSGTTGLVINSTTGEIDLSASTVASHTITYDTTSSGSSVCPNTSTQTVDIALAGIANNYSMSFDGSNDYVLTGFNPTTIGTGEYTVSLWFNTTTGLTEDFPYIYALGTASNYQGFSLSNRSGNTYKLRINNNSGGSYSQDVSATLNISAGTWYHIVITRSGNTINLYLDGNTTPYLSLNSSEVGSNTLNNTEFKIGFGDQAASTRFFGGNLDEVAIWNTALTSTQVSEIYNATDTNLTKDLTTVSGSNLIYWNRMGD